MPMPEGENGTTPKPRTKTRKRPCTICRRWFQPDARIGDRQRACTNTAECGAALRQKTQAEWRKRNPGYAATWRLDQRKHANQQPDPPEEKTRRIPAPLDKLPWDAAKDEINPQTIDFIALASILILRTTKDEIRAYLADSTGLPGGLPPSTQKTRSAAAHTDPRSPGVSPTRPPLAESARPGPAAPTPPADLTG